MSAQELIKKVSQKIGERRDAAVNTSINVRMRRSAFGDNFIPALTAEEIAMLVIEANAEARAYTNALADMAEAWREMHEVEDRLPQAKGKAPYQ